MAAAAVIDTAETLRTVGFARVDTYDPFVPALQHRIGPIVFDCVVCFEVVEHSTDPTSLFADINDTLDGSGIIPLLDPGAARRYRPPAS